MTDRFSDLSADVDDNEPASCTQTVTQLGGRERRRHTRHHVNVAAIAEITTDNQMSIRIVDASVSGFGLDQTLPCAIDDIIVIDIPDVGRFDARVAWVSDSRSGVELLRDLRTVTPAGVAALADDLTLIGS